MPLLATQLAIAAEQALVDTGQNACYDDAGTVIACPAAGQAFAGQDAQHEGRQPSYIDNGDGTVSDLVTGLMSQQTPGEKLTWDEARTEAASADLAGYSDWRLPTIKELQSLVDYTRSPVTSGIPAIDPVFITSLLDDGEVPNYWTSTTHMDGPARGDYAVYVTFGRGLGWMESPPGSGDYALLDVHGAGTQRSDPKTGDPDNYPLGHGPQGDVIRIFNFVRALRDAETSPEPHPGPEQAVSAE